MSGTRSSPRAGPERNVLFSASRRLATLEHFRVPYEVDRRPAGDGIEHIWSRGCGRALLWPTPPVELLPIAAYLGGSPGDGISIFAKIVPDRLAAALLSRQEGTWAPVDKLFGSDGEHVGSVWRGKNGSVFLPFDPDEVRLNFLSEQYQGVLHGDAGARRQYAMRAYYRARGVMPRSLQLWLRRNYSRLQARTQFPHWPIETAFHDFLEFFFALTESLADEPVPTIAPWPNDASWSLVLTHDVESAQGLAAMDSVLELERGLGLRSCWNFVPRRYDVEPGRIRALVSEGFEVGVHGLYHDGRDLESEQTLRKRLPGIRRAAADWHAAGFRSPATHRHWAMMPRLGFDYDSSYPDTDPFEPQGGGCCTWLPFFNEGMVELPITMAQDHTLFVILRQQDENAWVQKAEFLRSHNGMVLLDTHPDYLTDGKILAAYRRFLERYASDGKAWRALPGEVSAWWRRRAQSSLVRIGGSWRIVGPAAADGRIQCAFADADRDDSFTPGVVGPEGPLPAGRGNRPR